jgi:hypothetical protein
MKKKMIVQEYEGPGCEGPDEDLFTAQADTLAEARAIIRKRLGVSRLSPQRRWHPEDAIEAYSESLLEDIEFSGGYMIK